MPINISIIIPMYNAQPTLDRCLTAVLNSTYKADQVIVVDDRSTDKSPELAKTYPIETISNRVRPRHAIQGPGKHCQNGSFLWTRMWLSTTIPWTGYRMKSSSIPILQHLLVLMMIMPFIIHFLQIIKTSCIILSISIQTIRHLHFGEHAEPLKSRFFKRWGALMNRFEQRVSKTLSWDTG